MADPLRVGRPASLSMTVATRLSGRPTDDAPHRLRLDRGYDYAAVRELAVEQRLEAHIRTRGEELAEKVRDPTWRARRWVVEACHSWMNRNCALLIRWSKRPENHLALMQFAAGLIALKKAHTHRLDTALQG